MTEEYNYTTEIYKGANVINGIIKDNLEAHLPKYEILNTSKIVAYHKDHDTQIKIKAKKVPTAKIILSKKNLEITDKLLN